MHLCKGKCKQSKPTQLVKKRGFPAISEFLLALQWNLSLSRIPYKSNLRQKFAYGKIMNLEDISGEYKLLR